MPVIMEEKQERVFILMHKIIAISIILFAGICSSSCKKDTVDPTNDFFPPVQVYTSINLLFPAFTDLNNLQGYAYLPEGNRGIVVYHTIDDRYVAYDRTCSFNTKEACAFVSVDSTRVHLKCGQYKPDFKPCCNSSFDPNSGVVVSGDAKVPLKQYFVSHQGNTITISSSPF